MRAHVLLGPILVLGTLLQRVCFYAKVRIGIVLLPLLIANGVIVLIAGVPGRIDAVRSFGVDT